MRTHPHSNFVDLTKAFDMGNSEELWKLMQKFDCPERFTQMVRQLHDGMMARVTDKGAASEAFTVTNGVKRGCVLTPTLFSLMFSAMMMDAYHDERPRIRVAIIKDDHLLKQRRMHFHSPMTEGHMQRSMGPFSAACENFGLIINTEKTMVMHQPPPDAAYVVPQINVNGTSLQMVDNFKYLGSTLARTTKIDDEVDRRISKASQAFGRLQNTV
nr:unnamed protein product [Spirometra erinaceieuropaei]